MAGAAGCAKGEGGSEVAEGPLGTTAISTPDSSQVKSGTTFM